MYDYVIVGAGSAGCVLAARLGEDRDVRVAVIEAGPPDSEPVIHMPLAFRQLWESRFDWGLWSEREPGLGDRRDLLAAGARAGGLELAEHHDLHPRQPRRLRRVGGDGPWPAGAMRMCCPTSAARRTTSAGRATTTAWAGR